MKHIVGFLKLLGGIIVLIIVFNRIVPFILREDAADSSGEHDKINFSDIISSGHSVNLGDDINDYAEMTSSLVGDNVWTITITEYEEVLEPQFKKVGLSTCQSAFSLFLKFTLSEEFTEKQMKGIILTEDMGCDGYSDLYIKDKHVLFAALKLIEALYGDHEYFDSEISRFKKAAKACFNSENGGAGYFCEELAAYPLHDLTPRYNYDLSPIDEFTQCYDMKIESMKTKDNQDSKENAIAACRNHW